ncbi:MAG TPA: DNA-directed RNA polymerase subunit omega [Pyrinomonadaceae bacterium]|nr:DNA-directed RNA polymerase subunit omega [Pyrinomonadaceae bacterium]
MTEKNEAWNNDSGDDDGPARRQGIDSRFRLIVVAALRSKQLQRGAPPRVGADPLKRRSTSIALEEVRQGLVPFTVNDGDAEGGGAAEGRGGHEERNGVGDG